MKIVTRHVKHIILFLGITCLSFPLFSFPGNSFHLDSTLVCNELVHISFDDDCSNLITPDEILEGGTSNNSDYSISIEDVQGNDVQNPVTGNYLGETLTVTVTHNQSGNSCWGEILMEDKSPPEVFCFDVEIDCFRNPNTVPFPPAIDNCDSSPSVNLIDETIDESDPCNGVIITRTFIAIDDSDNESMPCVQIIKTILPPLPDFADDVTWTCEDYLNHNNVIEPTPLTNNLSTTGSGIPDVAIGNYCPYNVGHSDMTLESCGESFKIIRSWTILNWCTGEIIMQDINGDDNVQIIDVLDQEAPVIEIESYTVSANISGVHPEVCKSQDLLQIPLITEECGAWTLRIFTPIGEADYLNGNDGKEGGFIPSPGLPQGFYEIYYEGIDECGNIRIDTTEIEVIDDISPTLVCDEVTEVALTMDGLAEVQADVFDDGTSDNCCLDYFEVASMNDFCGNGTDFKPSVTFCCQDVSQSPVQVILRAYDCSGNFNDCMVDVNVVDKINPELISCPPPVTINCDVYKNDLETALDIGDYSVLGQYGSPNFIDNCQLFFQEFSVTENIDPCGEGVLIRKWIATDSSLNTPVECSSVIFVEHVSDWAVQFPDDILVTCTDSIPDSGEPQIFEETCELIAVSYEDQQFNVVQDACFKIKRTWVVVNWCEVGADIDDEIIESSEVDLVFDLNGNGILEERVFQDGLNTQNFDQNAFLFGAAPDGYITYEQVIKVIDNMAPIINCPEPFEVCIESNDCFTTVELPQPELIDCSEQLTLTANGDLGSGLAPFEEVEPGTYSMIYSVSDNCGNANSCEFEITVVDCKKPTPYCLNGLIVELQQDATLEIWATDFNAGSYDNCSDSLKFSFSADTTDIVDTVDCFDIGEVIITIWVTDEAGNQALCETFVFVQDNMGACMGPPRIAGIVENENGQGIKDVDVKLSGDDSNSYLTIPDGFFEFEDLELGNDYTVTPNKDINYKNGVTTFDLVLISKHILGTIQLDSPFKMLAADVNQSGTISTTDLVQIRRLILNIDTAFASCPSWKFMDKDFQFQNPTNPFLSNIPHVIDYNNILGDELNTDFIGWKMGDVNCSANPDNLINSDDRNVNGIFEMKVDQMFDNEVVKLDFFSNEKDILGFQHTFEFDSEKWTFIEFNEGILRNQNINLNRVGEGLITMSWNGEIKNLENTLFTLTFHSKTTEKNIEELLKINSKITEKEAFNSNFEFLDIKLNFEKPTFELYQNTPNPFSQITTISFQVIQSSFSTLTIFDTSGKIIQSKSGNFEKGHHEISFDFSELGSGVYYYQLTTIDGSQIRKMVK